MSEDRRRTFACVLLAVLALASYWNSLRVPFLFDDHESIDSNPTIKNLAAIGEVLNPPKIGSGVTGRPIVNLSLAVNYALSGTNPWSYHALNLALHVVAGLALFGVVRRTLEQWRASPRTTFGRPAAESSSIAFVAATIWTLHPLQTESVTCVIQRTEVLVGCFYLLTFYCFIRATEKPQSRFWPALAIAACVLGMASKEVMVSAPLMLLLYDRTFVSGSFRAAWERRRGLYLGLLGAWVLLGWLVFTMGGTRGNVAGVGLGVSPFAYALKQCEAILRYLWLSVWPHPLNVDYGEDLSVRPLVVLFGGAALIALFATMVRGVVRRRPWAFFAAWFLAILAPSSSVIPLLTQTIAEHRMYLPLAAVVVVAVLAGATWLSQARLAVATSVIAAFALLTACRNHDYRSTVAIWQDTVAKSPRNSRAHHNLGVALAQMGRSADAIACFRRALECKPTDAAAHYSLAHELAQSPERRAEAIAHYEAALRILPGHPTARINLANELAKIPERGPEAIRLLELELQLNPASSMAHNNLATMLLAQPDRVPEALAHAEQAVRLDPRNPELHYNLANVLKKIPARQSDAVSHYEQAVALRPNFFQAHYALANTLTTVPGRESDAIAHYAAALALQPDHAVAHFNLGVMLANTGRIAEAIREFETVLKLNPDSAEARENLQMLAARQK